MTYLADYTPHKGYPPDPTFAEVKETLVVLSTTRDLTPEGRNRLSRVRHVYKRVREESRWL